ncbi:LANO_0H08636g1_1 [Lachancea nothofagi CBS 11611]|uniref:LANO_0H08636g1_1 n=1 Tax=Lachancea nothofagi CBS 11611 TaxID=1266666 RepID=A0A1G4KLX2_9SACH|nr:LANO_0H08636g1_1 [Lachancea nothofagi CBS 11611]
MAKKGAVFAGSSLVLTYALWDPKYLSCESIKGIKQFSSSPGEQGSASTISLLSDSQVTQRLRQMEESYFVRRGRGILRYDSAQLPSNAPIEDTRVEQVITFPSTQPGADEDLYFFGVFDGHSGPYTSANLARTLVPYVAHQLGQVYNSVSESGPSSSSAVDAAITSAFLNLDRDLVQGSLGNLFKDPSKKNLASALPAISGSCALLTMFDSSNSCLKCAVTGDSRALLGIQDPDGQWSVKALSVDQTGDNPEEVERIRSEHPGEPGAVRNGRVLGSLQPSRAFGDYRYKVKELFGKTVQDLPDHLKVYFRREPRNFNSPPYVTAEPVITTTHVDSNSKFMVLASDGLFELLNNEEVMNLVVEWMNKERGSDINIKSVVAAPKAMSTFESTPSKCFIEDNNAATHLIRNALSSGGQRDYVSTLVSIPSPMSRKYRDDLTVTVVFFGDEADPSQVSGELSLNHNATAPPKPKL